MPPSTPGSNSANTITGRELAARVNESYSTIDYWSKMGLLEYVRRGNTRLYDAVKSMRRCQRIRERQNVGLNLVAIKEEFGRRR
jgi:DNA-binding transcriptional MerR regulator